MDGTAEPCITDAMKNFLSFRTACSLVDDDAGSAAAEPLELQGMARATLAAINRVPLPAEFPLPAGQTKATKCFGRTLLSYPGFFDAVRDSVLATPKALDAAALAGFVDDFERSFKDGVVDEADVKLGEIVWTADYAAAARERGLARTEQAVASHADRDEASEKALLTQMVQSGLQRDGDES